MPQGLFPVFDVPVEIVEPAGQGQRYRPAPLWDYENGDFVCNGSRQVAYGSGYDAWVLWCIKTMETQRWACLAYTSNAGIESEQAMAEPDRRAQESAFERTVSEALLADPAGRTSVVRNFVFVWRGDSLLVECEVVGHDGNSASVGANYDR